MISYGISQKIKHKSKKIKNRFRRNQKNGSKGVYLSFKNFENKKGKQPVNSYKIKNSTIN